METLKQLLWLLIFATPVVFIITNILDDILTTYKKAKIYKKQIQKKNRQIKELKQKQAFLYELYK